MPLPGSDKLEMAFETEKLQRITSFLLFETYINILLPLKYFFIDFSETC